MDHKDDSVEEILKRLKRLDHRLSSIEKLLRGEKESEERIDELFESGKEEKKAVEEPPQDKQEFAYPIRKEAGEVEEEKKPYVYERPKGPSKTKEPTKIKDTTVTPADQERLWINVLHKIGIVALIIGVGLFIKYSFPYIGLWGRIAIGLLIGTGLLYLGERLMKGYGPYALGISSCGIVILYFSFYAGSAFYELFSPAVAFLLMLLVTVLGILLSLRYDSSVISFIAVIGAFLTPFVFRGGEITPLALTILFLYLALINVWILTVTKIKEWKWLNILAFSLTAMMLFTTIKYSSESGYPWVFLTFSTAFFALFFYIPGKENAESYVILFFNPFLYYFVLWFVTYETNPYLAGTLSLGLSVFYYYNGTSAERKKSLDRAWSFMSLSIFFLTIAIPVFLKTNWATCAWAVEGAVILSLGRKEKILKSLSLVLLGIAVFKMFFVDYFILETFPFFFNSIVTIASVFLCANLLSGQKEVENKGLAEFLNILGMLLVFTFTRTGTDKFFDKFNHLDAMKSLAITILWGIYALALFIAGIAKDSSPARAAGFLMASLTILKVFFYDFSYLEITFRVLSFVALGIILLTISFIYQKKMRSKNYDK
jgi:uncharacterized membrane protein